MSKSNHPKLDFINKTNLAIICILVMFCGFIFSRVMLTLGTIAFIVNALIDISPFKYISKKNFYLAFAFLLIYFISGLLSNDVALGIDHAVTKIPILFFSLAFAYLPQFNKKQLVFCTLSIGLILIFSAIHSCSFLFYHFNYYMEAYKRSRVLPTINDNDYIRLSVGISLYLLWIINFSRQLSNKTLKSFLYLLSLCLFIYLHILAAKSGLLIVYLFSIVYAFYLIFNKQYKLGLVWLSGLMAILACAYFFIPTFHHRIGYISFTIIMFNSGDKSGIYGDIGRLISFDIAWHIIKQHPIWGVGVGNMYKAMQQGYNEWYPNLAENLRILPHNQFLTVAMTCGLPALLVFILWVVEPLTYIKKNRESFFLIMVWIALFIQLMIEPTLELQYGIFIYVFFLNWQLHRVRANETRRSNFWFSPKTAWL